MLVLDATSDQMAHVLASMTAEDQGTNAILPRAELLADAPDSRTPADLIRASFHDLDQIQRIPPPTYLVEGVVTTDSLGTIYGAPGSSKSFVALSMALSVAHGVPWMGRDVKPGPVLYVAAEGVSGMGMRVRAWLDHHAPGPALFPVMFVTCPVNLFVREWAIALADVCTDLCPALVVVDTLARCAVGAEENSAKDMGVIVDALDTVRQRTDAAVIAVHHTGKDKTRGGRGSNALQGGATFELEVTGTPTTTTVTFAKVKDGERPPTIHLARHKVGRSLVLVPASRPSIGVGPANTLAVLKDMQTPEGVTATNWRGAVTVGKSTFYKHVNDLMAAGCVRDIGSTGAPLYVTTGGSSDDP